MKLEPAQPRAGEREYWSWRRTLERQLHDGAALRISALTLQLGLFRHRVPDPDLREAVDRMQDELHAVLQELRAVSERIYPPLLDEAGLGPALQGSADLDVVVREEDGVLVIDVDGAAPDLAEAMRTQVLRLGGTIDVAAGSITARIPCE